MAPTVKRSWLQFRHPDYIRDVARWIFARDHYTGDLLLGANPKIVGEQLSPSPFTYAANSLRAYLIKRDQGETEQAYRERAMLADYTNHFATIVDSLAGMMFATEDKTDRRWANDKDKGLGDVKDPTTVAGRLWLDADGDGHGWLTLWKMLATDLTVYHTAWILVDSIQGEPRVRIINPTEVVNWRYDETGLAEVLVKECVDARTSIMDDPTETTQYIMFSREGWQRYRDDGKGGIVEMTDTAAGDNGKYSYTNRAGFPALPIYPVSLPLSRHVGWLLAKKANIIFNKESERDHLLRTANFPRLVLHASDDLYEAIIEALKKGISVLQAQPDGATHTYIAPDPGPATIATEVLKRKVEEFYITAFREYGDAAREKTATEVKQDTSAGVGAYLQHLKAALDDAENNAFWRIEQTLDPTNTGKHFIAHVERSDDFGPLDAETMVLNLQTRYFGEKIPIPVGKAGKLAAAKMIAELDGIKVDDEEIEAAVDAWSLLDWFSAAHNIEMPAELRVEILKKVLAATHLVDPADVIDGAEGEKINLLELITARAMEQANAKDTADRRQAENTFGPGGNF